MNILETIDLTKIYQRKKVANGINIQIKSGQIVGLLGRNGAGKTTTFLMIAGIIRPHSGTILLNKESINSYPSFKRAQKGLIYMPQQHSVFLKATVFENLYMVCQQKNGPAISKEDILSILNEFNLIRVKDSKAYQISGGEKRRLEIARIMMMNPKFIFLDEPFTGIDPITIIELKKIIQKLRGKGIGIIITDHNVRDTFDITDHVYILHHGQILSSGLPNDVVHESKTRDLFLGSDFDWNLE